MKIAIDADMAFYLSVMFVNVCEVRSMLMFLFLSVTFSHCIKWTLCGQSLLKVLVHVSADEWTGL